MKLIKKELVPALSSQDRRLPKIIKLRGEGTSLQDIGKIYGLSRQRIKQIIDRKDAEVILYIYECQKCKARESRNRQMNFSCINCLIKNRKEKKVTVNQIFKGEPEWRMEGRENVRFKVRYRDNFTCQDCKKVRTPQEVHRHNKKFKTGKGKIKLFDVHHLGGVCGKKSRGYDNASAMDGMITLCHNCHYNHPEHTIQRKKEVTNTQNLSS